MNEGKYFWAIHTIGLQRWLQFGTAHCNRNRDSVIGFYIKHAAEGVFIQKHLSYRAETIFGIALKLDCFFAQRLLRDFSKERFLLVVKDKAKAGWFH